LACLPSASTRADILLGIDSYNSLMYLDSIEFHSFLSFFQSLSLEEKHSPLKRNFSPFHTHSMRLRSGLWAGHPSFRISFPLNHSSILWYLWQLGCDFVKQIVFLPSQKAQCPKAKIIFQQKSIGRAWRKKKTQSKKFCDAL